MKMTPRLIIIGGLAVVLTVVAFVVFLPYVVFQPEADRSRPSPTPRSSSRAATSTSATAACTATASSRAPVT